jgi:hypothetical protein
MKNMTKFLVYLSCVALLATACEKENEPAPNPFEGADNHITSFVLKKDDVSYRAVIAPGAITVTVPLNVSLAGFTAEYQLCENAKINPDPAATTDWDSEQQFAVTAYNGAKTTYIYTVERSGVVHTGAVILHTQAEVDAFGQGSYTIVDGYLAIGRTSGKDTITSLAPLAGLKTITGGLFVNAMYMGEDLVFNYLETVGELHVLSKTVKTVRFPKLAAVRLNMNFDQASAITTLDFPELTTIDKSLQIYYVDSLATMRFPKLKRVIENVTIEGRTGVNKQNLQSIDFPELTGVGACTLTNLNELKQITVPKLETAGGVNLAACVTLAAINFPALKTVNGNLTLSGSTVTTGLQLPALNTVEGTLSLTLPGLTSLEGLSSLRKVGALVAADLRKLETLDVRGIEEIGSLSFGNNTLWYTSGLTLVGNEEFPGNLSFSYPNQLTAGTFPVVEGIKKVGGLSVSTMRFYIDTLDFSWLEEVTGLLSTSNCNMVKKINLSNLTKAGGLNLAGLLSIIDTLSLPKLEEITGYTSGTTTAVGFVFTVSSASFTTLDMPKLERVEGNISITEPFAGANRLQALRLPELVSLTGTLTVSGYTGSPKNSKFTDLSGLSALRSAAGVTISNFTNLEDFSPLGKVVCSLPAANKWNITGCKANPAYQEMIDTYCDE